MIEKSRLLRKNDGRKRTNGNNKDISICNENGDAKKEHRRTTTHATRPLRDNMCVYHQDETPLLGFARKREVQMVHATPYPKKSNLYLQQKYCRTDFFSKGGMYW